MGQQQLLLLVLGTVIVGLAVVVGIDAFSENRKKSNADALVNDAVRLASDAQAWRLKPAAFGGGADDDDFTNLTLEDLGYETNGDGNYENLNGEFSFGFDSGNLEIIATNQETQNQVTVTVEGTDSDDITTQVTELASN